MNEDRYSRQRHITEDFNQAALQGAAVLIVGVGGLGTHVATSLATAGIGTLMLCDYDTVAISNLNRQPLYSENDLGCKKVDVASKKLSVLNPHSEIIAYDTKFTLQEFVSEKTPDLILDCLDNLSSRLELIAYAVTHNTPLIHGAVEGFNGQVSVFIPGKTACPFCSLSAFGDQNNPPPASLGSCVSLTAALQATEAIKMLAGTGQPCTNKLLFFDALTSTFDSFEIEPDANCLACSIGEEKK